MARSCLYCSHPAARTSGKSIANRQLSECCPRFLLNVERNIGLAASGYRTAEADIDRNCHSVPLGLGVMSMLEESRRRIGLGLLGLWLASGLYVHYEAPQLMPKFSTASEFVGRVLVLILPDDDNDKY